MASPVPVLAVRYGTRRRKGSRAIAVLGGTALDGARGTLLDVGTEEIRGSQYEQNFARSMSLDQIAETDPILAYEMNGEPLTTGHGFPLRLVVPFAAGGPTDTVTRLIAEPMAEELGQQIVVPTRPAFVTVAGAVVNNNAFLWKPGKTVGEYIGSAGLDEAAEPSNMFILRADGTVLHASESRGFFGGSNLDSVALNPGDALVVPNKLDYETWGRALVRNLKDWSQIFSQFGLGAAAIITLRNN